jgi:hypothetical protein
MNEGLSSSEMKEAFTFFPSIIDNDSLKRTVAEKQDASVRELAQPYACLIMAVCNALKKP